MTELEPITLIRNNKFIEVEENFVSQEKGTKNRASFQIDNLKVYFNTLSEYESLQLYTIKNTSEIAT